MDKLNMLHKILLVTVAALFAVNQSVMTKIERDVRDAFPQVKTEVVLSGVGATAIDNQPKGFAAGAIDDQIVITDGSTLLAGSLKKMARAIDSLAREIE